jgi:hypothetical protein
VCQILIVQILIEVENILMLIEEDLTNRFERAMFNLLRSFNFIDLNVGLLIATTPQLETQAELYKKLSRKSFDQKMKWFSRLLEESALSQHIGKKGVSDFQDWYSSAHMAREIRNRYVHSIWRFNSMRLGAPVEISSPPWMKEILGSGIVEYMSLEELEEQSIMVESVFENFYNLRKKHVV